MKGKAGESDVEKEREGARQRVEVKEERLALQTSSTLQLVPAVLFVPVRSAAKSSY